jgi:hypothetical protein
MLDDVESFSFSALVKQEAQMDDPKRDDSDPNQMGPRPERPSEGLPGEGIGPLDEVASADASEDVAAALSEAPVGPIPTIPGLPDKGKGPLDA